MHARLPIQVLLLCLFATPLARAHPPTSVVMDARGIVFYSDLERVWMIRPDGSKEIAVDDVHTHELFVDADDNLYGEDVRNVGEAYRHRVWKRAPDGTLTDVLPWRDGYPDEFADYAFIKDRRGRSYVLRRDVRRIDIRNAGRVARSIDLSTIDGYIHWMAVHGPGNIFVAVGSNVYGIPAGSDRPMVLARDLAARTEAFSFVHDRHALMGMWTDRAGSLFVAVYSGQVVLKLAPGGGISVAARSTGEWSPAGGLTDAEGALWLLEFSSSNQARVRKVAADGTETVF